MKSKVRVSTAKLLEAVITRRDEQIAKFEKDTATYETRHATFQAKVVAALYKAAANAEKGKLPERGWRTLDVPFPKDEPTEPSLNTAQIDRLIKTLEMASDDAILVSADDAAQYLG